MPNWIQNSSIKTECLLTLGFLGGGLYLAKNYGKGPSSEVAHFIFENRGFTEPLIVSLTATSASYLSHKSVTWLNQHYQANLSPHDQIDYIGALSIATSFIGVLVLTPYLSSGSCWTWEYSPFFVMDGGIVALASVAGLFIENSHKTPPTQSFETATATGLISFVALSYITLIYKVAFSSISENYMLFLKGVIPTPAILGFSYLISKGAAESATSEITKVDLYTKIIFSALSSLILIPYYSYLLNKQFTILQQTVIHTVLGTATAVSLTMLIPK